MTHLDALLSKRETARSLHLLTVTMATQWKYCISWLPYQSQNIMSIMECSRKEVSCMRVNSNDVYSISEVTKLYFESLRDEIVMIMKRLALHQITIAESKVTRNPMKMKSLTFIALKRTCRKRQKSIPSIQTRQCKFGENEHVIEVSQLVMFKRLKQLPWTIPRNLLLPF